jgi:hypothetical protein
MAESIATQSSDNHFNTTHPPHLYDPAFTEEDANVVLASSDGRYYRVPSYALRTTSGFFHGMMTLPQGDNQQDEDIIVLDEKSQVLGTLLRMIAGLEFQRLKSFDELEDLLTAAEKYDMPGPRAIIRTIITTPLFLEKPLRLYAIAARYGWEEEAKFASKHTLALSIYKDEYAAILERMPVSYLMRLLRLHRERVAKFKEYITRGDGCFGIQRCPNCHRKAIQTSIGHLVNLMISEMDQRPDGREVLAGNWKKWPIYKENESCSPDCGATYRKHWPGIAENIENCFNSLPSTI